MTVDGKTEKKWPVYCDAKRIMLGDRMKFKGESWIVRAIQLCESGDSIVIAEKDNGTYDSIKAIECALLASKDREARYYDGKLVQVGEWYVDPDELRKEHRPILHCASVEKIDGRTDLLPEKLFICGDSGYVKTGETYYGGDNTRWEVIGYNVTEKQGHIVKVRSVADPMKERDVKAKWLEHNYHNTFADIRRDLRMDPSEYCLNFGCGVVDPKSYMLSHIRQRMDRCENGR